MRWRHPRVASSSPSGDGRDLRDLLPARQAGPTDSARASYVDRFEILNGALSGAVAEVVRLREQLELGHQRNASLDKKKRRLLDRPS